MGCGCNKKKDITAATLMGERLEPVSKISSGVVLPSRSEEMISKLRADELLAMPYSLALEPSLLKVTTQEIATRVLSALSDMDVYNLSDVLNLTKTTLLSEAFCGPECLSSLKEALTRLGFDKWQ